MEVVFGRSAEGSLKQALHELPGSHSLQDVFCFSLGYSMGDVSGDGLGEERADSLRALLSLFPEELDYALADLQQSRTDLEELLRRGGKGEPIRIWYSEQPDEYCGLCWLLGRIRERMESLPAITAVRLPAVVQKETVVLRHQSWGEVRPQEFLAYADQTMEITGALVTAGSMKWKEMQEDNSALRAKINGKLQSVPDSFYDPFLEQELARIPAGGEIREAVLIGNVMGRYQLGIGDLWLALRVEEFIRQGRLTVAAQTGIGIPLYRRMLKKV